MPIDLPAHNAPIAYNKGNWVPNGWAPLHTTPRIRHNVFAHIAKRRLEDKDKESQRTAIKKRREEKVLMRERANEELGKCEVDMETLKKKREDLIRQKHEVFSQLKACLQKESQAKKADEERKKREYLQQPALLAAIHAQQVQAGAQAQSNSLISQQNLMAQQFNHNIISGLQKDLFQQQLARSPLPSQQSSSKTPVLLQQAMGMQQMVAPHLMGSRPPTRNFPASQQQLVSPRRERAHSTLSPNRYAVAPSRHNSFGQLAGRQVLGVQDVKSEGVLELASPAPSPAPQRSYPSYPPSDAAAAFVHALANYQNQHRAGTSGSASNLAGRR